MLLDIGVDFQELRGLNYLFERSGRACSAAQLLETVLRRAKQLLLRPDFPLDFQLQVLDLDIDEVGDGKLVQVIDRLLSQSLLLLGPGLRVVIVLEGLRQEGLPHLARYKSRRLL